MDRIKIIIVTLTVAVLLACDPGVVFQESNPPSIPSIQSFPEAFQGVFLCQSDSTLMRINKFNVINESYHFFKASLKEVTESEYCSIVDGGLHINGRSECYPFDYIGEDSVAAKIYYLDTLFSFQQGEVAKLYKDQLFINTLNDQNDWVTWVLRPTEEGNLEFSLIYVPVTEKVVSEITDDYKVRQLKKDKIQYIMKPTLSQFNEILNKDYTRLCEILVPVNVEFQYPDRVFN